MLKNIYDLTILLIGLGMNKDGAFGADLNKYIVNTFTIFVGVLVVAWVIKALIVYPSFGLKLLLILFTVGAIYLNRDYLPLPSDLD